MVFRKRVIAPLAFAWTLAAAGMAAVAFSAAPARVSIDDVQIGERGDQTRIAFICSAECALEKRDGAFLLASADASFDIDLSRRSARVDRVRATPVEGGALIKVATGGVVEYAKAKSCTVGGRPAACLDLFFAESERSEPAATTQPASRPAPAEAGAREAAQDEPGPPATERNKGARPALRETAEERLSAFASLAPPERLAPPAGAILAKVQPIEKTIEVGQPSIRAEAALAPRSGGDFAARVRFILGKELTPAFCNNAEATLQADAWALGAMVDAGLCAAARGDVADADAMLARLLQYTPDNYEALVGRAVIAEQADEKGVARKYYQDALNALPPIEESNRIVQAVAELK